MLPREWDQRRANMSGTKPAGHRIVSNGTTESNNFPQIKFMYTFAYPTSQFRIFYSPNTFSLPQAGILCGHYWITFCDCIFLQFKSISFFSVVFYNIPLLIYDVSKTVLVFIFTAYTQQTLYWTSNYIVYQMIFAHKFIYKMTFNFRIYISKICG